MILSAISSFKYKTKRFCGELVADALNHIGVTSDPISKNTVDVMQAIIDLCGVKDDKIFHQPTQLITNNFVDDLTTPNPGYCDDSCPKCKGHSQST